MTTKREHRGNGANRKQLSQQVSQESSGKTGKRVNLTKTAITMDLPNPKGKSLRTSSSGLKARLSVPGDKSISHRSIILGSIAEGQTRVSGFLRAEDCLATLTVMRQLGVKITDDETKDEIVIEGRGWSGLKATTEPLDCGNSGTTMRLLSGVLAGQAFESQLLGDSSLNQRPMGRIMDPLGEMGASLSGYLDTELPPLDIKPVEKLSGITYEMTVASAQVKSAIMLAALQAEGETTIIEKVLSRNHTEEMLRLFGVELEVERKAIRIRGGQKLTGQDVEVPGDISSAAYFLALGLLLPETELTIENVGLNQTRSGMLDVIQAMGGDLTITPRENGISADLTVRSSQLNNTVIEGSIIPRLIDELPVIALMATQANGVTVIRDAEELKVKETDRIKAVATQLNAMGASIISTEDGWLIRGQTDLHSADVKSFGDHRIGMMLQIAALLVKEGEVHLKEADCVNISYPTFFDTIDTLLESGPEEGQGKNE